MAKKNLFIFGTNEKKNLFFTAGKIKNCFNMGKNRLFWYIFLKKIWLKRFNILQPEFDSS